MGVTRELLCVPEGIVFSYGLEYELLIPERGGRLDVYEDTVDYCVDMPFDSVDFDLFLCLFYRVTGFLDEEKKELFDYVSVQEFEIRLRRDIFLRIAFRHVPELPVWATQRGKPKGVIKDFSLCKTGPKEVLEVLCELVEVFFIRLVSVVWVEEGIDVVD